MTMIGAFLLKEPAGRLQTGGLGAGSRFQIGRHDA
jgi:hypothetical protein